MSDALARAVDGYERVFGRAPEAAAFAPGRVNLIGDHTDYAGGLAMPMALEAGCVAAVGPESGRIRAAAVDLDDTHECASGSDPASWPGWARYVIGSAQSAIDAGGCSATGLCVAVASDVPIGAGLSSSAAVEVAVVSAFESLHGLRLDPMEKARAARRAEREFAGVPCGMLDQMAAVFGRERHAMIIDFAGESVEHARLPDDASVLLIDTGVRHNNASGAYSALRDRAERARAALGVEHLARAHPETIRTLALEERAVAEHVASESERVRSFASAISSGDLRLAGSVLDAGHASLVDRLCTSVPAVDSVVDRLRRTPGVLGCRMTGAGFGGFVVALTTDRSDAPAALDGLRVRRVRAGAGCRAIVRF